MKYFAPPSPRSIISVTGNDGFSFLQGMITNDMNLLQSQNSIYAALLTPQGKVISTFFVVTNPDGGFFLDCPSNAFEPLLKRFNMFRLRADVKIIAVSDQYQIILTKAKTPGICFIDPRNKNLGYRVIAVQDKAQLKPAPDMRFTLMVPEQDIDFGTGEVFPTDINMDLQNGIAWRKGCYVGQEVVSRMKRRGNIRKRTVLATFAGPKLNSGTEIISGKTKLGHITSSSQSHALAVIRIDRLAKVINDGITANAQTVTITAPKEISK